MSGRGRAACPRRTWARAAFVAGVMAAGGCSGPDRALAHLAGAPTAARRAVVATPVGALVRARTEARSAPGAREAASEPKPASPRVLAPPQPALPGAPAATQASITAPLGARGAPDHAAPFRAWAGQTDSLPEQVLIELQIDHAASQTVLAYRVGAEALVPMTALLRLGEQGFRLSPDGRLEATMDPGRVALVIDPARDTMRLGERRVPIASTQRVFTDGELYVAARPVAALFDTQILVDWQDLTVTLMDANKLPIGLRLQRETAREAFERRSSTAPIHPLAFATERPTWDGLVVDYSFLAAGQQPLNGGGYALGVGGDVLGGSLQLGMQSVGPTGAGQAEASGSWTGVWDENRWVKELRLGDGYATGPETRAERGLVLTNAPYLRPSLLGAVAYAGRLDSGWTVEAYRAGQLVAIDSTDPRGAFAVPLPISYGENPVDFVAYGPSGQVVLFDQTYRTLNDQLPARHFEYGLTAGQCPLATCTATANLDLHYGVSDRLTVRGGIDQFWRDTLSNRTYPYATLLYLPINALAIDLMGVAGSSAGATVQFEPSLNLQATATFTSYTTDTAPALPVGGLRSTWAVSAFLRPAPRSGFFFFDAQASGARTTTETVTTGLLQASVQTHEVRLEPYVRVQADAPLAAPATTTPYVGMDAFVLPHPALGQVLGAVWMRLHLEQQVTGAFQAAQLYVDRPVGAGLRVELGLGKQIGIPGVTLTTALTSNLPSVRTVTTVTTPTVGPSTASQYVQGSLLWDRGSGALRYAPGPSLERSGLTGRVFVDENGNGRWDPGEPLVAGVRVLVSNGSALSDSSGLYRVWNLAPFDTVTVAVDSLSIDSPLLVPAFSAATLELGPNRFRTLDIPLERAGVVEGRVLEQTPEGPRGRASLPLVLVNRRTGAERRFGTFSDGAFYVLGIVSGDYELRVEDRALEAAHAVAAPLRFTLDPGASGAGVSGLELILRPTGAGP